MIQCLLLLGTSSGSTIANIITCWIALEQLWTTLIIMTNQDYRTAKWSESRLLSCHLVAVGNSLSEHIGGHLISILVSKLCSLLTSEGDLNASIGNHSSDDTANAGGQCKNLRNGIRVEQLVLWSEGKDELVKLRHVALLQFALCNSRYGDSTYRDLLLGDNGTSVSSANAHRCDSGIAYCFKCVF